VATYSFPTRQELSDLAGEYGVELDSARPIEGGISNSSFLINQRFVLTLLDAHNVASADALVEVTEHVAHHGIPTNSFLTASTGRKVSAWRGVPAVMKVFVTGEPIAPASPSLQTVAVGMMHAVHGLPAPSGLRAGVRRFPANWEGALADWDCDQLRASIRQALMNFSATDFSSHGQALTHGDFFLDNIILGDDDRVYILDWEYAAIDFPVVDLAILLVSNISNLDADVAELADEILSSYLSVAPKSRICLPQLLAAANYMAALLAFHRFCTQNIRHQKVHPDLNSDALIRVADHIHGAMIRRQ